MCDFNIKTFPQQPDWNLYNTLNNEEYNKILNNDLYVCTELFMENIKTYIKLAKSLECGLHSKEIKNKKELNFKFDLTVKKYNELKNQFDDFNKRYKNAIDVENVIQNSMIKITNLSDAYGLGFLENHNNKFVARDLIDSINEKLMSDPVFYYNINASFFVKY